MRGELKSTKKERAKLDCQPTRRTCASEMRAQREILAGVCTVPFFAFVLLHFSFVRERLSPPSPRPFRPPPTFVTTSAWGVYRLPLH